MRDLSKNKQIPFRKAVLSPGYVYMASWCGMGKRRLPASGNSCGFTSSGKAELLKLAR